MSPGVMKLAPCSRAAKATSPSHKAFSGIPHSPQFAICVQHKYADVTNVRGVPVVVPEEREISRSCFDRRSSYRIRDDEDGENVNALSFGDRNTLL